MLAFSSLLGNVEGQNIYRIWYDKPASYWEEALPVGNGRIAAMVFGDPQLEQIQLNEETVSAGSPYQNYNEEAKTALPEMRRLIFEGKYEEAQNMAATKILSQVGNEMPYQTVGRLNIRYQDHKKVNNYYRDLDISNAVAVTRYEVDGVEFTEETFASFTDQLVIRHIKASKPGTANNTVSLALGRRTDTGHSANCRISDLYRTRHPLYRLYLNSHIGCSGTGDSSIFRCSPVSRKTDSPVNGRYFNDYHRCYLDYHR